MEQHSYQSKTTWKKTKKKNTDLKHQTEDGMGNIKSKIYAARTERTEEKFKEKKKKRTKSEEKSSIRDHR